MKKLIIALTCGLLTLGVINCGKKGGGSAAPAPTAEGKVTDNSAQISFGGNNNRTVSWSQSAQNIYYPLSNGCVQGLRNGADGTAVVAALYNEIAALINSSTIARGSRSQALADSVYMTISYANGSSRLFNLDNDKAAADQEILSNGPAIKQIYFEILAELSNNGFVNCSGGDKNNK